MHKLHQPRRQLRQLAAMHFWSMRGAELNSYAYCLFKGHCDASRHAQDILKDY